MATTSISTLQIAMSRSCIPSSQKFADVSTEICVGKSKGGSWNKLVSACHVASVQPFQRSFTSSSVKSVKFATKAVSESSETSPISGLPINLKGGSSISLTYIASERIIPGYGGDMSSAKAALESDTRVLAFEAGRKRKIGVNTISAGPLRSRAAKAIGFIDMMIDYSIANAPLQKELSAE
ncbi:unnamed protein product [Lathyrus oleraceus]